jgi:hypothetical protein
LRPGYEKGLMIMLKLHLEILMHPLRGFQVRVVDPDGRTFKVFSYPTIESARMGAEALTVKYGNCRIDDTSGMK